MEQSASVTHRPVLIISPFLAFHNGAMDLGDHDAGVHNVVMDIGDDFIGGHCKLGLPVNI